MRDLTGTWRLLRAVSRDADGKVLRAPYDGHGMGRIVIGADGRMSVMMIDARAEIPPGERREYSGYSGTYSFDGTQLITTVDCAPDPSRIGSAQVRGVRFDGALMILRPPPREQGGVMEHRELTWEKISDS